MWVATQSGFYSAVEDRSDPKILIVRTRVYEDAWHLAKFAVKRVKLKASPRKLIRSTPKADYLWRVTVSRNVWKRFLAREIDQLDYDNFKNRILTFDPEREHIYSWVWLILRELDRTRPYERRVLDGLLETQEAINVPS